ncbi:MAG: hypothetical protein CM15mP126_7580 [Gammaproteobacteria bacterium]|nr:MAG: hypothetical protein CM15mP126_7580 [Gammaproteobacteria bacterium]
MSHPLISIIIRVAFVCLALILLAYFLFLNNFCSNFNPHILYLEIYKFKIIEKLSTKEIESHLSYLKGWKGLTILYLLNIISSLWK